MLRFDRKSHKHYVVIRLKRLSMHAELYTRLTRLICADKCNNCRLITIICMIPSNGLLSKRKYKQSHLKANYRTRWNEIDLRTRHYINTMEHLSFVMMTDELRLNGNYTRRTTSAFYLRFEGKTPNRKCVKIYRIEHFCEWPIQGLLGCCWIAQQITFVYVPV